ncbi:MAG: CPBP family glutamic-type intramembrane protease [Victivallaceae bacterium]|nr:CPBP family glutamic-type intramembrane protease [Victivallaceae bacterium]
MDRILLSAALALLASGAALAENAPAAKSSNADKVTRSFLKRGEAAQNQKDYPEAVKYYEKAADKGDVKAMNNLGCLYFKGGNGLKKDYAEAVKWFRKAADKGEDRAVFALGVLYLKNRSNYAEAFACLNRAGESKDRDIAVHAHLLLAIFYLEKFPPDFEKSREHAQKILSFDSINGKKYGDTRRLATFILFITRIVENIYSSGMGKKVFTAYYFFLFASFGIVQLIVLVMAVIAAYKKYLKKIAPASRPSSFSVTDAVIAFEIYLIPIFLIGMLSPVAGKNISAFLSLVTGNVISIERMQEVMLFSCGLTGVLSFVVFWIIIVRWRKLHFREVLKLHPVKTSGILKWTILSLLAVSGVSYLYECVCRLSGISLKPQIIEEIAKNFTVSHRAAAGIPIVLIGGFIIPFLEEVIFRGVIFQGFAAKTPFWPTALISSFLFAVIHMEISAVLPIFFIGMVLCYAYKKTGSLLAPISIHSANNIIAILIAI